MKASYENEKRRGDELNDIRKKIDELRAKADERLTRRPIREEEPNAVMEGQAHDKNPTDDGRDSPKSSGIGTEVPYT